MKDLNMIFDLDMFDWDICLTELFGWIFVDKDVGMFDSRARAGTASVTSPQPLPAACCGCYRRHYCYYQHHHYHWGC